MLAPASSSDDSLVVVWNKPEDDNGINGYGLFINGDKVATVSSSQMYYVFDNLDAGCNYELGVCAIFATGWSEVVVIDARTVVKRPVIDVTKEPYQVNQTGENLETDSLQRAINDCPLNGKVVIPKDAIVLTGALNLKSNMTLEINGTLLGSANPDDYLAQGDKGDGRFVNEDGLVLSRYEGWEMYCYRSLLNAGYLDQENRHNITCHNVQITGTGVIVGGGNELGIKMRHNYSNQEKYPQYVSDQIGGRRVRGRLISCIQCKDVYMANLRIENPPCWTIHMIYCDTVTTNGLRITSQGVDNGDGWDPDSSRNMMIFNTVFNTSDDCIAIKSGKNPQGNLIGIPTENVRIFNLNMIGGNGIAIGSEESGGVRQVDVQNCQLRETRYGIELKANPDRGGYISDVKIQNSTLSHLLIHEVNYNSDGERAHQLPLFSNVNIENSTIENSEDLIEVIGFQKGSEIRRIENIYFRNVDLVPNQMKSIIKLKNCENVVFKNVGGLNSDQISLSVDQQTVENLTVTH